MAVCSRDSNIYLYTIPNGEISFRKPKVLQVNFFSVCQLLITSKFKQTCHFLSLNMLFHLYITTQLHRLREQELRLSGYIAKRFSFSNQYLFYQFMKYNNKWARVNYLKLLHLPQFTDLVWTNSLTSRSETLIAYFTSFDMEQSKKF